MDFLAENIKALNQRYKGVDWPAFLAIPSVAYELRSSKSGGLTLYVEGLAAHSIYNPCDEAKKQAVTTDTSCDAVILLGFGLGYLATQLHHQHPHKFLYLAENRPSLWRAFFEASSQSALIKSSRVTFIFGFETDNELTQLWHQRAHATLNTITNRALHQGYGQFYQHLHSVAQNYVMRKNVNASTLERYGYLWMRNLAKNLPFMATLPGVKTLFNHFNHLPAILIAAGPSLNNYLGYLSFLKERALIVCVDTALPALLKAGVKPDIVVAVDSQYWNSRHFDHCYSPGTLLIADPSIYPTVLNRNHGFACYLSSSLFPLGRLIEESIDIKGTLTSGGSVATSAYSLCKALGCPSIWALGLDLSYPKGQSHVNGSRFEEWALADHHRLSPLNNSLFNFTHSTKVANYPANKGGVVQSDQRMTVYRLWFEEQSTPTTYNLSDGILIDKMATKQIDDALALPPCRHQIDRLLGSLATQYQHHQPKIEEVFRIKAKLASEFKTLEQLATRAEKETEIIITHHQKKDVSHNIKQLEAIDQELIAHKGGEVVGFLLEPFLTNYIKSQQSSQSALQQVKASQKLYQKISQQSYNYWLLFQ